MIWRGGVVGWGGPSRCLVRWDGVARHWLRPRICSRHQDATYQYLKKSYVIHHFIGDKWIWYQTSICGKHIEVVSSKIEAKECERKSDRSEHGDVREEAGWGHTHTGFYTRCRGLQAWKVTLVENEEIAKARTIILVSFFARIRNNKHVIMRSISLYDNLSSWVFNAAIFDW